MSVIEKFERAVETAQQELRSRSEALDVARTAIDDAGDDADLDALRTAYETPGKAFDEQAEEVERCKANLADETRRAKILEDNPVVREAGAAGQRHVGAAVYSAETASERSFFTDAYSFQFRATRSPGSGSSGTAGRTRRDARSRASSSATSAPRRSPG
jgi:hypothetical protein